MVGAIECCGYVTSDVLDVSGYVSNVLDLSIVSDVLAASDNSDALDVSGVSDVSHVSRVFKMEDA